MYRLGSKDKLSSKIQKHFPAHSIYIEPFFGIGGMYFNKKLSSINLLNDLDNSIHTFWITIKENSDALIECFEEVPITEETFKYYKNLKPKDNIEKALQFIYLNSFSLFGSGSSFMSGNIVKKESVLEGIKKYLKTDHLQKGVFYSKDFRNFLKDLTFVPSQIDRIFIYADPPYLNKLNNYNTPKWIEKDLIDLIESCLSLNVKFAISEFYSLQIKEMADKYRLNIASIVERKNILNIEEEILLTNYKSSVNFLDLL